MENNFLLVDDVKINIQDLNGKEEILIENKFKINLNLEICFVKEKLFSFEKGDSFFKDFSSNEFHLIFKNLEEKTSVETIKEYENTNSVQFKDYDFIECLNHDLLVSTFEISFLLTFKASEQEDLNDLPLFSTNEKEIFISTFYSSFIQRDDTKITTKENETTKEDFIFGLDQIYKKNDWNKKVVTYSSSYLKEYYNGVLFSKVKIENQLPIKDSVNVS